MPRLTPADDPAAEAADDVFAAAMAEGGGYLGVDTEGNDDDEEFAFDDEGREITPTAGTTSTGGGGDAAAKRLTFATPVATGAAPTDARGTATITPASALATLANVAVPTPQLATGGGRSNGASA